MNITIAHAVAKYLDTVRMARSQNTARAYYNGMRLFQAVLKENHIDPENALISVLTEDAASWMADSLKDFSPATEQLYLAATVRFFEYLAAERLAEINLPRLRLLLRQRARRPGQRLPQFPRNDIEAVLEYVNNFTNNLPEIPVGTVTRIKGPGVFAYPGRYRLAGPRSLLVASRGYRLE